MTTEDMTVHVKGLNPTFSALNLPLSLSSCCTGESTCLPPMWPGFKSQCRHHMWFEFVVGSLPCSKRFFSGTPVFPSPQNPIFPDSNSIRNQVDEELLFGCATSDSLYIISTFYSFIILQSNCQWAICMMISFNHYYQSASVCCIVVQIRPTVV